jgi:type III restriction enzyme
MALELKRYQRESVKALKEFLESATKTGPSKAFTKHVQDGLRAQYLPIKGTPDVPYVCLRIPTGGGKTVMGAHIIKTAHTAYLAPGAPTGTYPLVVWLVPTTTIKDQTLDAFKDLRHPYRQELDAAFDGQVAIFDIADFATIRVADIQTKCCVVISTVASLRRETKEGLLVYQEHEDLKNHFPAAVLDLPSLDKGENGKGLTSFANLCKIYRPIVLTDEAHNANTPLSYDVYERLAARVVVELTATPDGDSSNVLVAVSAFELQEQDMIKFPVVLKEHLGDWRQAVDAALARRVMLARVALEEAGTYIRPIVLIQAESEGKPATVEAIEAHLEASGVDKNTVRVATGTRRGLVGEDLFDPTNKVEIIITKQALKEGWDCSFAYVFCSVAQVKSDKDIQQLLGRVLRMPYAKKRTREELNKAYAHVTTTTFGESAGELTSSLVSIGFNPLEAARAVREEPEELPLEGGNSAPAPKAPPKTRIRVESTPDLTAIPEADLPSVAYIPAEDGKGGYVEITDHVDATTVEEIVLVAPKSERDHVRSTIELHQQKALAAKAPSERGDTFSVPRLMVLDQGDLDFVEARAVSTTFRWDLLATPADLSTLSVKDESKTFEVFLGDETVSFKLTDNDAATYLPGFAEDRTEVDLVGFLERELWTATKTDLMIGSPVRREWVRLAVRSLIDRGFSLAQLLRAQYILARKLVEEWERVKTIAFKAGFEQFLFAHDADVVVGHGPDHTFTYPKDFVEYAARTYYAGNYTFSKHYYPVPGDLPWKTATGALREEFQCAQQIDMLDDVEFWVRNLVAKNQFWMPTSKMRTYPDFVAKLKDGRLLVIEYKGGDRVSNDDSAEKRMVGNLWERRSGGMGLYLMATKDDAGQDVRTQLLQKIANV